MLQLSWRNWPCADTGKTAGKGMLQPFKHVGLRGSPVPLEPVVSVGICEAGPALRLE